MSNKNLENHDLTTGAAAKKKPIFKKWWFWVIAVFIAVGVYGGSSGNQVKKGEPQQQAQEPQQTQETQQTEETQEASLNQDNAQQPEELIYGLNETAVFPDMEITATAVKTSNGTDFTKPDSGNTFIGAQFEIKNTSDKEQNISSLLLFDTYVDDVKADYSFSANVVFGDGTLDGSIAAGKKMIGWIAVEASQDAKDLEFVVKDSWLSKNNATFKFTIE